jgi:hypothetical protein
MLLPRCSLCALLPTITLLSGACVDDAASVDDPASDDDAASDMFGDDDLLGWGVIAVSNGSESQVDALFMARTADLGPSCDVSMLGDCSITRCMDLGATFPALESAGTLTAAGGMLSPTVIPVLPSLGVYSLSMPGRLFSAGDTLRVQATGGVVPAFDLEIAVPAHVSITAPAFPPLPASLTLGRETSTEVRWAGGLAQDIVQVDLAQFGATGSVMVQCRYQASSGNGTIPAAALGVFTAGYGQITIGSVREQTTIVGRWGIDGDARDVATSGGVEAQGAVAFQ